MIHQSLKRFGMEGTAKDNTDFLRLRPQFEALVIEEMKGAGYVPVFGLGPFWSTAYNKEGEEYTFILSLHGYRVGRRKACTIKGVTAEGKMIPYTPPPKSNPSFKNVK